jgi:hypothetical protein
MLSTIRWGRVIVAGVGSEVGVIATLLVGIAIYRWLNAPAPAPVDNQRIGERLGYYIAPAAGFLTTFLTALWATQGLASGVILTGLFVGVISVAIALPFLFSARPEHRLMYGVAFALRLIAGCLAGVVVRALR